MVSGEHGIGITKMKFLDRQLIDELSVYRRQIDPRGVMNPGKLVDPDIVDKVFTPSFNLLELEARILQHRGSLETLASKISKCIRCGKCKADCCVFYPGSTIFFHPRNKNLAIGSLIEALLYDMQRSHFPRFNQLKNLEEIADHCTLCGKCLKPCPVDIDTAQVSILEREILSERGYKHWPLPTRMSLHFLKTRNRLYNSLFRKAVVELGRQPATDRSGDDAASAQGLDHQEMAIGEHAAIADDVTLQTFAAHGPPENLAQRGPAAQSTRRCPENGLLFPGLRFRTALCRHRRGIDLQPAQNRGAGGPAAAASLLRLSGPSQCQN